jgi:hypothetical protein
MREDKLPKTCKMLLQAFRLSALPSSYLSLKIPIFSLVTQSEYIYSTESTSKHKKINK